MLREQGELQGSLNLGTNGFNLQGAYAVTNRWGILGNLQNVSPRTALEWETHRSLVAERKVELFEVGLGRTMPYAKQKRIFEWYTGVGTSNQLLALGTGVDKTLTQASAYNFFTQVALGSEKRKKNRYYAFNTALRINTLHYTAFVTRENASTNPQNNTNARIIFDGRLTQTFIAGVLDYKVGGEAMRLNFQCGFNARLGDLTVRPNVIGIGVHIRLPTY